MADGEASSVRLVASLGVAGLLSGVILVGVYLGTLPAIERNRAEAMTSAVYRVLPGTTRIETFEVRDGEPVRYEGPEGTLPKGEAVFAGYGEDGHLVGFAIPAEGSGFMDTIKLVYGYEPTDRKIVGMEVLDSRETPGLGDKIVSDPEFHANFDALATEPRIVPVKKGKKTAPNEVDCITGATISSEAVVRILNDSTGRWRPIVDRMLASGGASK